MDKDYNLRCRVDVRKATDPSCWKLVIKSKWMNGRLEPPSTDEGLYIYIITYRCSEDKVIIDSRIVNQDRSGDDAQSHADHGQRREEEPGHNQAVVPLHNGDVCNVPHSYPENR